MRGFGSIVIPPLAILLLVGCSGSSAPSGDNSDQDLASATSGLTSQDVQFMLGGTPLAGLQDISYFVDGDKMEFRKYVAGDPWTLPEGMERLLRTKVKRTGLREKLGGQPSLQLDFHTIRPSDGLVIVALKLSLLDSVSIQDRDLELSSCPIWVRTRTVYSHPEDIEASVLQGVGDLADEFVLEFFTTREWIQKREG